MTGPSDPRPTRLLDWKETPDGNVEVLRPKFGAGRLGRWLSKRMTRPYLVIRLDAMGSFVWKRCDGEHTVAQIVAELREHEGAQASDLDARLGLFLDRMAQRGMIAR